LNETAVPGHTTCHPASSHPGISSPPILEAADPTPGIGPPDVPVYNGQFCAGDRLYNFHGRIGGQIVPAKVIELVKIFM
jgi:hypothetical protein